MSWSDQLQPWLRAPAEYLVRLGAPYGVKVTSVYRSPTKQAELYANRGNNPYPVARPGTSYHEYGRAFDLVARSDVLAWLSGGLGDPPS